MEEVSFLVSKKVINRATARDCPYKTVISITFDSLNPYQPNCMYSKEEGHSQISGLVERFQEQLPFYKKSDYNETLTRMDFIDPFFKALGWNMNNSQGNAEAYGEVIYEDKIKIGSATKAPDYSFRLRGERNDVIITKRKTTSHPSR